MFTDSQISLLADLLTESVVAGCRFKELTSDQIRQVELAVAAQLETGKRAMLTYTTFCPPSDLAAPDVNDPDKPFTEGQ